MSAIQATDETFDPFVLIHQSVTARLQIVEVELEMAETKSRELEASLEQVRDQAEESRVVEKHLLNNLKQFSPSEVQETFANIRETQLSVERVQLEYEFLTARRAELKDQGQFLRSASQILADLQRMYGENGSPPRATSSFATRRARCSKSSKRSGCASLATCTTGRPNRWPTSCFRRRSWSGCSTATPSSW